MGATQQKWLVLVVGTGGHLIPTPEHLAPKNTKYIDEDGVIRDYRAAPTVVNHKLEMPQGPTLTEKKIRHLLENRKSILTDYYRLLTMPDNFSDVEGLTIRAVDYSRPSVQKQSSGESAQNAMINLLDLDRIAKEQEMQRDERRQAIEAAKEQADAIRLIDLLILKLPAMYHGVLLNAYFLSVECDLIKLSEAKRKKQIESAIRELAKQYETHTRGLALKDMPPNAPD